MLDLMRRVLQGSCTEADSEGQFPSGAAVLIALTDDPEDPELILTRRASHMSTHAGEVALPGGKWDSSDSSLLQTALRESEEEIGLDPAVVEVVGALPARQSKWGLTVTPFVGVIPAKTSLTPNFDELDSIFAVPLRYLLTDPRESTDHFHRRGRKVWVPCYRYQGYEIWGFTANLLLTLLNDVFDARICEQSPAPARHFN